MVARVHHATIAKAEKLGLVIEADLDASAYVVRWPERNKFVVSTSATEAVEDAKLLKMLTLEYAGIKPVQKKDNTWTLSAQGEIVAKGATLTGAWDAFCDGRDPEEFDELVEDDGGDDESEEDEENKSVVKHKYKAAYKPFKQKCGDEFSQLVTQHVGIFNDKGVMVEIDRDKLRSWAQRNGVWNERYEFLNNGMARMNVRNRLFPRWQKDPNSVIWG